MKIEVGQTPDPQGRCGIAPDLDQDVYKPVIHCTNPPHGPDVPHSWETKK